MKYSSRSKRISGLFFLVVIVVASITVSYVLITQKDTSIADSEASSVDNKDNSRVIVEGKKLLKDGNPYFVNGVMYVGVKDRPGTVSILSTFSKEIFDINTIEKEIKDIKVNGYNTIRIAYFANEDGKTTEQASYCKNLYESRIDSCLEKESLDNLANTIKLAQKYNIKVILSFVGGTPFTYYSSSSLPYNGQNINFLKEETINDYGRFLKDILKYLQDKQVDFDTFFAIQPYAEPSIDTAAYPFDGSIETLEYPEFYVPVGKKYLIKGKDKSSEELKDIYKYAVINAYNKWTSDVKSINADVNVLFEQYPQFAVKNESRLVLDSVLYSEFIKAEIIGMQLYPDYIINDVASIVGLFENSEDYKKLSGLAKPFIILEYGFIKDGPNSVRTSEDLFIVDSWINQMCHLNIAGISFFNWNADNFNYQTAKDNDYLISKFVNQKLNTQKFECSQFSTNSTVTPKHFNNQIKGDYDRDGMIDIKDFSRFMEYYGEKNIEADLNTDGVINLSDFVLFRESYVKGF